MRPIRRILVAIKDPARPTPAVTKATQLAHAFGAELELYHAIAAPLYVDPYSLEKSPTDTESELRSKRLKQLEAIAIGLRRKNIQVSVSANWDFPVYEAIVRHADRTKAGLIVADCHAKPHIAPGLLQLTDWELLRASQVPVLLVKTPRPYRNPVVLAAVDPAHACAKPVKLDAEILLAATSFSKALRGSLHAVHAYIPLAATVTHILKPEVMLELDARTEAAARREFERAVRPARIIKTRCHLVARHPIDAIQETARSIRSAVVVMGAISRSGFKRFLFGNTAEALLDSLSCDLLIVKPANFAARVQKRVRGARLAVLPMPPTM
jgi:universal stress protein E